MADREPLLQIEDEPQETRIIQEQIEAIQPGPAHIGEDIAQADAASAKADVYAPMPCSCSLRGNCERLPERVRNIGEFVGSHICNVVRRARKKGSEQEDRDLEELSLWALRYTIKKDGDGAEPVVTYHYFMVTHIL